MSPLERPIVSDLDRVLVVRPFGHLLPDRVDVGPIEVSRAVPTPAPNVPGVGLELDGVRLLLGEEAVVRAVCWGGSGGRFESSRSSNDVARNKKEGTGVTHTTSGPAGPCAGRPGGRRSVGTRGWRSGSGDPGE